MKLFSQGAAQKLHGEVVALRAALEKDESDRDKLRALMFKIEESLARYEVVSLPDNQHITVAISGRDAKKICKLMGDTV